MGRDGARQVGTLSFSFARIFWLDVVGRRVSVLAAQRPAQLYLPSYTSKSPPAGQTSAPQPAAQSRASSVLSHCWRRPETLAALVVLLAQPTPKMVWQPRGTLAIAAGSQ